MYDLLTPSILQFFDVADNFLYGLAYLVAAGVNKIYDAVQVPDSCSRLQAPETHREVHGNLF